MICFGQGKWIGEGEHCAKKIQVLLCSTPLVTGIIQFVDISISKTTLKNFKKAKCRNPWTVKRITRRYYGIIQNIKKGKAKWHKNCALKLSASKHSHKKRKDSLRFLWLCSKSNNHSFWILPHLKSSSLWQ